MGQLDGRTAVITGGGGEIGRAVALRFAREGADVLVADVNAGRAREVAQEISALGRRGLAMHVDVSDFAQIQTFAERAVADFGRIDILFNNAGIAQARPLLEITEQDWDAMFAVNCKGAFFVMQSFGRTMLAQGYGKIINTASISGRPWARPMLAHYAATKAAVISFTYSAATALAPNVRVNALCPGVVDTAMWRKLDEEWSASMGWPRGEAWRQRILGIPLGRPETPEDLTGLCVFLASADSDYMTGQAINLDGGLVNG